MGLSEEIRRLPEAWRFALVRKGPDGTKKAYERGWPQGIDHDQVEQKLSHPRCVASMVGVILGEVSGGIVAIDHDGDGADEVLREVFGLEQLPETAMITSGRPGRFCAFYTLPESEWPGLRKMVWDSSVEGEQLEVRWGNPRGGGHQQVVGGIHPNGNAYRWLRHPSQGIAELPPQILRVWRDRLQGEKREAAPARLRPAPQVGDNVIPPEVLICPGNRELIRNGVSKGGRDQTGIALACDLQGVESWANSNGYRLRERPRGLFVDFCNNCQPPLSERDANRLWDSAASRNPTPSLSEEKLQNNVRAFLKREHREVAVLRASVNVQERAVGLPFQCLGFNKDLYVYLPKGQKQVLTITASSHVERRLLTLAPQSFWLNTYPKETKTGTTIDWGLAISNLYEMQHLQGVYDPRRVRGRGCWIDEDRVVIHLGDRVMVNRDEVEVGAVDSHFIYEQGPRLSKPDFNQPLDVTQSRWLLETAQMCRWEHPGAAAMLSGWVVLAPICGALSWRPHCWMVGGAGSGKSTILADFTKPLLGEMETSVLGASTEAGLRQALGSDAIPVLMDEAEQAQARDEERLQSIMELARASSSETGAKTLKGTANGTGQEYLIRSMFLLSSITSSLKQGSDKSRFLLLQLHNPANDTPEESEEFAKQWEQLRQRFASITPEIGRRLIARTVARLPQLLREIQVFSDCAAKVFGSRRAGDQFGSLLAGAYSLTTDEEATQEIAMAFINQHDWEDFLEPARAAADHERCLSRILEHRVKTGALGEPDVPLGELLEVSLGRTLHGEIDKTLADKLLQRCGVKVEKNDNALAILISANHTAIGKVLERTPWSNDWRTVLKQIPGADVTPSTYFRGGHQSRAIRIPAEQIKKKS